MRGNNLILVGGRSGSGKTTLVSALIWCFPSLYERPISCTTRSRRYDESGDEYDFISIGEFERLHQNNEFLNIDLVYDNYYAMKTESVLDVIRHGRAPIKEIHPQNHTKIRAAFDGVTLSVLVKPSLVSESDNERILQDNAYYSSICEDNFDIVFYYDADSSPEKNAHYFHQKITALLKYSDAFPPSGEIDALNRDGYGKAADYFTEEKRITTRNFHELSAAFFTATFSEYVNLDSKVLEIGPGQGWLSNTVFPNCGSYTCIDISDAMANTNSTNDKVISSVRCIESKLEIYDVIVASLADPYFYPEAICEIARILKYGGYFIFSIPSIEWASALRSGEREHNKTSFILDSGECAEVFSFTFSSDVLESLMDSCGFQKIRLTSGTGEGLLGKEISTAITKAADNINKSIANLDVVTMAVFMKKGA